MSPENDQTRWIGIRPTNPAENIPVTESAPLTQIKVESLAVGTEFKTLTKKRTPAIADLQAIETPVQLYDMTLAVAGYNFITLGEVPANKLWVVTSVACYCSNNNPSSVTARVYNGTNLIIFFNQTGIVGNDVYTQVCNIILNPEDKLRFYWVGCVAFDPLYSMAFGYQIAKY